jgi:exopolysaccharide biosynthesis WecB/TagA/CpsF family protein
MTAYQALPALRAIWRANCFFEYGADVDEEFMRRIETTSLAGLNVAVLTRAETAAHMIERSLARRGAGGRCDYHTAVNGQVVAEWRKSATLTAAFSLADVISVDSTPLVLASKYFGTATLPERVATSDLFFDVAAAAEQLGISFYLFGGDEPTNARAAAAAVRQFPNLKIAGRRNGFFEPHEEAEIVAEINTAAPDILWVGMGVPLQETFALNNREKLPNVGVLKTCGGCFRYLSGELIRAPLWMQRTGLEWAFLACLDPRNRLIRYVRTNPLAVYNLLRESPRRL